jgi:hypothetical protein
VFGKHVATLGQVAAVSFVMLVLGKVGYQVIWNAVFTVFPSWGAFFGFLGVVALISAVITFTRSH